MNADAQSAAEPLEPAVDASPAQLPKRPIKRPREYEYVEERSASVQLSDRDEFNAKRAGTLSSVRGCQCLIADHKFEQRCYELYRQKFQEIEGDPQVMRAIDLSITCSDNVIHCLEHLLSLHATDDYTVEPQSPEFGAYMSALVEFNQAYGCFIDMVYWSEPAYEKESDQVTRCQRTIMTWPTPELFR